jgi:23S rRNA (uracil1939-C5)-methyltransferase
MSEILDIIRLGRQGDGIAESANGPVYVPFTLAKECVRVRGKGNRKILDTVLSSSVSREKPVCTHYGECGGCQLQHFEYNAYLAWKTDLLREALLREGIDTQILPILGFGTHMRRRAVFTAKRAGNKIIFGFSARTSNNIVGITQCPVLVPAIETRLDALAGLANLFVPHRREMKMAVLACEGGLDIAITFNGQASEKAIQQAITIAVSSGLARLTVNHECLIELTKPYLHCGIARITPPPGGFVQAVAEAESAMSALACNHLRSCRRVADLFSGAGNFALRIAQRSIVHACEMDGESLHALDQAWRACGGRLKTITSEKRDLFRSPLMKTELDIYDGAVFDPPRAGAQSQAKELAKSNITRIAAISCNPVTLARDLRILIDGGYRIKSVTPIDQFVFTPHLEAVALLERANL